MTPATPTDRLPMVSGAATPLINPTTDPEARLARKGPGKEAKLSYAGCVLMENRNGIAVNGCVTPAEGRAELQAALAMVEEIPGQHRVTLGADKGYDRKEFVQELRDHQVTHHIACKQTSIIDARTNRHPLRDQPAQTQTG